MGNMKKVKALILGTDNNSYSVAKSYNEAFGDRALTVGSGLLAPYRSTKLSDLVYEKGFSSHDDQFVSMLNEACKKYPDTSFVIFAPNEVYLNILSKNLDKFDFEFKTAYPLGEIYEKYFLKSKFYQYLDTIGVKYPKTQIIDMNNIDDLDIDGELFMKADDFPALYNLDFDLKQKGYQVPDNKEAKRILREIYKAGYKSDMIVQQYINGGDGSEYSLNGYRAHDGKTSMVLARNIISDNRALSVGNHIVQVDSNIKEMYDLASYITEKLGYVGLFNFDFKMDSKTGEIFVLEMNQRQGRTFYYANLAGVNLIELCINDMMYNESSIVKPSKKFRLMTLSEKCLEKQIQPSLLKEFNDPERIKNSANPLLNDVDKSITRNIRIKEQIKNLEKEIFGN